MNSWISFLALSALYFAAPSAEAVSLNPHGTGQVLIFPYYTVNGGNQTLLTIVNGQFSAKALRVRFIEGRNGREVYSFNLYLGGNDVWTGALFSLNAGGAANLVSDDVSCAVPAIRMLNVAPMLPDGRHYESFSNASYSGANHDAGPADLARTREGYVEVIEMGSLIDQSNTDRALANDPPTCSQVLNAWQTGGYWTLNPKTDLVNPTGGLFGSIAIVNTSAGTMLTYSADALEDFRQDSTHASNNSVVLHTFKSDPHPTLADALTDPVNQTASAWVVVGGRPLRLDYPASRAIDAVSATLMVTDHTSEYTIDPRMGAQTEWIQTFPTRRFYTDQALVGAAAIPPFTSIYPTTGTEAEAIFCEGAAYGAYDRQRHSAVRGQHIDVVNAFENCYTVHTIPMNQSDQTRSDAASWLRSTLTAKLEDGAPADFSFTSGWMTVAFEPPAISFPRPRLRAALDGKQLTGLPVLGFVATNYVNAKLTAGVLANYSGAFPYRSGTECRLGDVQCP
jgi:hypothetical protein